MFLPRSTVIGLRGKDGVVFAVEKIITSKLFEQSTNKRIFTVDRHVGLVRLQHVKSIDTSIERWSQHSNLTRFYRKNYVFAIFVLFVDSPSTVCLGDLAVS